MLFILHVHQLLPPFWVEVLNLMLYDGADPRR